ncbi:MAG: serine hydroxymethyltransferase [Bacilli bacterium]|nr:serine hydroxymethyltransferase [Bacilli bacterium]
MQDIKLLIQKELDRQNNGIELIASENYASKDIREVTGSILTNKYAEGYPHRRYYGGCEFIDEIEQIAIDEAKKLFKCEFANVQPHSGSQANAAAYRALMPNGGKVLSLVLNDGGHLTHGSPVSFSSNLYTFVHYPLDKNGYLDYEVIREIALREKPNVILSGYSAYPHAIDFKKFREICDEVGAYLMVDMAHIAGLIATGEHMSPIPYADIVTSTTHKTLRGPRGGLILTNNPDLAKKINSAIFPYYQGGPLEHVIAGKAVCFKEANTPEFKKYIQGVKENTKQCAETLKSLGALCTETDNHLFLLNVLDSFGITGLEAQNKLEEIFITTNKNMIPNDTKSPKETSGLRIGFAAVTTRGCTKEDASKIGKIIFDYLKHNIDKDFAQKEVKKIISKWKSIENI